MTEPSPSERKGFLRVLSSLAWADGVLEDEELTILHLTANDLSTALTERDVEPRDLETLAGKVTHPDLRRRLLGELKSLAEADDHVARSELMTIKYFATAWELEPPAMDGVDWDAVHID